MGLPKNQRSMCGSKQMNPKEQQQHQACRECTKRCLKVHGKKPSSSLPPPQFSFFKIMIGDFEDAMFVPPKIARNFGHLLEDETYLEDSDARRWRVGVSLVDGSLAFRQGWRDFLLDHNVCAGELVVFECISDSTLSVRIFGTNACERLHFSETRNGNRRKRKRDEIGISPNVLQFEENNGSSERSNGKQAEEDKMIEVAPCAVSAVEITGEKISATDVEGGLDSPYRNSSFDYSMELLVASPMNYSEGPCGTNNGDAVGLKEVELIGQKCHSEDTGIEIPPKENSDFEISGEKISAKDVVDNLDSPDKNTPFDNSMRLLVATPMNYFEGSCDKNNVDAMGVEEVGNISSIYSCDDQDTAIKIPPKENSDDEITGEKSSAEAVFKSAPLDNSMKLLATSPINYSKGLCDPNNGDAVGVEKVDKISFTGSCDDEDTGIELPPKENSLAFVDSHGRLQIECPDKFGNDGKGNLVPCGIFSRHVLTKENTTTGNHVTVFEQEVTDIPPIHFLDLGTIERQCYLTERLRVDEEKLSRQRNNLQGSQNESAVECIDSEAANQSKASRAIVTYPLTEKGMSTVDRPQGQNLADNGWIIEQGLQKFHAWDLSDIEMIGSEPSTEELIANFSRCVDESWNAYERDNLFATNDTACEYLISEEEKCCNVDEYLTDKVEPNKDAPIFFSDIEREDSPCRCDETLVTKNKSHVCEDSLELRSDETIANCTEDVKGKVMPSCESIEETRTKVKLGDVPTSESGMIYASNVEPVGSHPLTMAYASEFPKDSERNSFPTGTTPEDSSEVDKKKVDSSTQEKLFRVVKAESIDLEDLQRQNSASFIFSVSVNTQPWLKLPKRLPIPGKIGRRSLDRRVVMLRDPKMKLWPILYYESPKFIGFTSGWKEFVTANNIREGDMYQIELINEEEPTFQMCSSKA